MSHLEYQPISTLYHYTGTGAFDGIVESGQIWLSDLRFANDPKELRLAETMSDEIVALAADRNLVESDRVFFRRLSDRISTFRSRQGLYSFSASLQTDSLPMWQEYTERGTGYCLGFRATAFNHMNARVQRVRYVPRSEYEDVRRDVLSILRPFMQSDCGDIDLVLACVELYVRATATKDESWKHENEVRLIRASLAKPTDRFYGTSIPIGIEGNGTLEFPTDPETRTRGSDKIPYYVKNFGRQKHGGWDASGAICEIIIGPNNPKSTNEIEDFMRTHGYRNLRVMKSKCEFR